MKNAKKLVSLLLALAMVFAMATTAFAQEVSSGTGSGSITISNAAKGETYKIYKLFDASVTGDQNGSIAYTGDIPDTLKEYFTKDNLGYISATEAAYKGTGQVKEMSDELKTALAGWVKTAVEIKRVESNGSELKFKGLSYGYYVVTTTQGEQLISVDSTNPSMTIVDKNKTVPTGLTKSVDKDDVNIGDTVTYTVNFKTANYNGEGEAAKKIVSYTIEDTLPGFLTNVNVTSIVVDNDGNAATTNDQINVTAQFDEGKIVIGWCDEETGQFKYNNGATITITYTAVVTDRAAIAGNGNTNKVTVTWTTEGSEEPGPGKLEGEETIYTYAIALKKVNEKGEALAGAKFELPFCVKETPDDNGAYIYAGKSAGDGLTNQLTTPEKGVITIKGVASGEYKINEVTAPDGYNKLTGPVTVKAIKTSETATHTTFYLDENGNIVDKATAVKVTYDNDNIAATAILVVNKSGLELPSTGGTGTTIFYILGGILVIGAAILLIVKRRMRAES